MPTLTTHARTNTLVPSRLRRRPLLQTLASLIGPAIPLQPPAGEVPVGGAGSTHSPPAARAHWRASDEMALPVTDSETRASDSHFQVLPQHRHRVQARQAGWSRCNACVLCSEILESDPESDQLFVVVMLRCAIVIVCSVIFALLSRCRTTSGRCTKFCSCGSWVSEPRDVVVMTDSDDASVHSASGGKLVPIPRRAARPQAATEQPHCPPKARDSDSLSEQPEVVGPVAVDLA